MKLRWAASLAIACLVAVLPAATASHPQAFSNGTTVTFKEKTGGNEWWVEVIVGSTTGVSKVEVMDDGGPWAPMTYRPEWGSWALSYHVEPGHRVTFRATTSSGVMTSCPFTHPQAVEQCGSSPPPPPPPPPPTGTFDAGFNAVRGNEWWIQSTVSTNGPAIARVDVTLDQGNTWKPLAKQSWGGWAASYHITQGTIVQLRATALDGQQDLSRCRQWIPPPNTDAALVECGSSPPPPPPPPPPSGVTFSGVKGNDYWIEAVIKAPSQVYSVMAVFDCDPNQDPHDMTYRADWGKWTLGGTPIPRGTRVTFDVYGEFGSAQSQGYIWPAATPTSGCPPPPDWYRDGSYAEYAVYHDMCGGGHCDQTRATLRMTLRDPGFPAAPFWDATCTGTVTHTAPDGTRTVESFSGPSPTSPPVMTRTPRVGFQIGSSNQPNLPSTFNSDFGQYCMHDDYDDWSGLTTTGTQTKQMALLDANGQRRTMTVWHAQDSDTSDSESRTIEWETRVGLVLSWERTGHMSGMAHYGGDLVRTNAPV